MKLEGSRKNLFAVLINSMKQYRHNYRTRRQLLLLDDRALNDIGVTRAEALQEGRKPFWKGCRATPDIRSVSTRPALAMFTSVIIVSALTLRFW